jgi:hypothetical protein
MSAGLTVHSPSGLHSGGNGSGAIGKQKNDARPRASQRGLGLAICLFCMGWLFVILNNQIEQETQHLLLAAAFCFFASFSFFASWIHAAARRSSAAIITFLEALRQYMANESLHHPRGD